AKPAVTLSRRRPGTAGLGLALVAASIGVPTATASAAPAGNTSDVPLLPHSVLPTSLAGGNVRALPAPNISVAAPATAVPLAKGSVTYTVKAGDTVSHIALRTGTSVQAIVKENKLNSKAFIRFGQKLTIPNATKVSKSSSKTKSTAKSSTYTVKSGDTVSHIALRTGASVQAIIKANKLNSNALIRVGQKLTIPGTQSSSSASKTSTSKATTTNTKKVNYATYSGDSVDRNTLVSGRSGASVRN